MGALSVKTRPWGAVDALLGISLWTAAHVCLMLVMRRCVDDTLPTGGNSPRNAYWQGMVVQVRA
jgi:hypothetical protein